MHISESRIRGFSMDDFIWACDRAFHLFNLGKVKNLPREERIEKLGDLMKMVKVQVYIKVLMEEIIGA